MKVLIAEDDKIFQEGLKTILADWGFEVIIASNGKEAFKILTQFDPPQLALVDWMMPEMEGIELCRKIRELKHLDSTYLILVTSLETKSDIVLGLKAGANDYVTKPFDSEELHARVSVGVRMVELQKKLKDHISELEDALARVKQLQGLLPICSYCRKIRDDKNYWFELDDYLNKSMDTRFTHGICPDCHKEHFEPMLEQLKIQKEKGNLTPWDIGWKDEETGKK